MIENSGAKREGERRVIGVAAANAGQYKNKCRRKNVLTCRAAMDALQWKCLTQPFIRHVEACCCQRMWGMGVEIESQNKPRG